MALTPILTPGSLPVPLTPTTVAMTTTGPARRGQDPLILPVLPKQSQTTTHGSQNTQQMNSLGLANGQVGSSPRPRHGASHRQSRATRQKPTANPSYINHLPHSSSTPTTTASSTPSRVTNNSHSSSRLNPIRGQSPSLFVQKTEAISIRPRPPPSPSPPPPPPPALKKLSVVGKANRNSATRRPVSTRMAREAGARASGLGVRPDQQQSGRSRAPGGLRSPVGLGGSGRQFTVGNIGHNGLIYLRWVVVLATVNFSVGILLQRNCAGLRFDLLTGESPIDPFYVRPRSCRDKEHHYTLLTKYSLRPRGYRRQLAIEEETVPLATRAYYQAPSQYGKQLMPRNQDGRASTSPVNPDNPPTNQENPLVDFGHVPSLLRMIERAGQAGALARERSRSSFDQCPDETRADEHLMIPRTAKAFMGRTWMSAFRRSVCPGPSSAQEEAQ
jgi:hypothetical protein